MNAMSLLRVKEVALSKDNVIDRASQPASQPESNHRLPLLQKLNIPHYSIPGLTSDQPLPVVPTTILPDHVTAKAYPHPRVQRRSPSTPGNE